MGKNTRNIETAELESDRYGSLLPGSARRKKTFESSLKGHPDWVDALLLAGVSKTDVDAELGRLASGAFESTANNQNKAS